MLPLVKDILNSDEGNHGFELILQNEQKYRSVRYASTQHSDAARWPKLTITYTQLNEAYYLKDYPSIALRAGLGNIRVTLDGNGNVLTIPIRTLASGLANRDKIVQDFTDDYYPFGLQMPGRSYNIAMTGNQYKFSGTPKRTLTSCSQIGVKSSRISRNWIKKGAWTGTMQFIPMFFIGSARYYDPAIGRWESVDPHTASYPSLTPYNYVGNNPLRFIDPTGLDSIAAAKLTKAAENAVKTVKKSDPKGSQPAKCNIGVNCAVVEVTGNTELTGKTANKIADHVEGDDNWEPSDLEDVQSSANEGEVNIGVSKGKDGKSGHVVMAVPGEETPSGSWGGKVPNVMDTGAGKRWSKKGVNYSWKGSQKKNVKWYKYKKSSTTKRKIIGPLP